MGSIISEEGSKRIGRNRPVMAFLKQHVSGNSLPLLTLVMFVFFGIHNVLQEAIMKVPGFHFGVILGYFEVLGCVMCSRF